MPYCRPGVHRAYAVNYSGTWRAPGSSAPVPQCPRASRPPPMSTLNCHKPGMGRHVGRIQDLGGSLVIAKLPAQTAAVLLHRRSVYFVVSFPPPVRTFGPSTHLRSNCDTLDSLDLCWLMRRQCTECKLISQPVSRQKITKHILGNQGSPWGRVWTPIFKKTWPWEHDSARSRRCLRLLTRPGGSRRGCT